MSIRLSLPFALALTSVGLVAQTTPPDFFGGVFGTPTSAVQFVVLDANLNTVEENPPITNTLASGAGRVIIRYERPATGPKKATVLVSMDITAAEATVVRLAHIHKGALGVNGPVVLDFNLPSAGPFPIAAGATSHIQLQFEVTAAATLATIDEIIANPGAFYFNVHSVQNPGGFIRGQLVENNLSALRRTEARSSANESLFRRLLVQMAAKDGLITIAERDALLAQ
jgi:hypothetical protein